jgi:hypothetical protein
VLTPTALEAGAFDLLALRALTLDADASLAVGALLLETLSLEPLGKRLALWAHRRTHAAAG